MLSKEDKIKLKRVIKIVMKPFIMLCIRKDIWWKIIDLYSPEEFNKGSQKILTYKYRSKEAFINERIEAKINDKKVGVIIQGPIKIEDSFTYNTVKNYLKILNPKHIVVSTWEDENKKIISDIEELGVKVIKNKKPNMPGYSNINYQITTTISALRYLKKINIEYVVKSRTDTRLENNNSFAFLVSILENFKLDYNIKDQKQRIALIDFNTKLNRPFNISDIFQFGNIDDLIELWSMPLDTRENNFDIDRNYSTKELFDMLIAENYVMKSFLDNKKIEYVYDLDKYYHILAKYFIIVDSNSIGHYWYKYRNSEGWLDKGTGSFSEWFLLYNKYNENRRKI